VKVLDFGISKAMPSAEADAPTLTTTQSVFGSPAYMSPEQVRSAKRADHRSDVWGLCVILYELLTGEVPFRGEGSSGTLAAIIADAPEPPGALRKEISAELGAVVMHCLEKDPWARFQTVAELARALKMHGGPTARDLALRVEKIGPPRTSGSGLSARPPDAAPSSGRLPPVAPAPISAPSAGTIASSSITIDPMEARPKRSRAPLVLGGLAVLVLGALAVGWRVGSSGANETKTTSGAASARETATTHESVTAPPVASVAPPSDAPQTASARPMNSPVNSGWRGSRPRLRPSRPIDPGAPAATAPTPTPTQTTTATATQTATAPNVPAFDPDRR
jgi:serine/threonine-protein kinase